VVSVQILSYAKLSPPALEDSAVLSNLRLDASPIFFGLLRLQVQWCINGALLGSHRYSSSIISPTSRATST
jgi:hypothetical protein